MRCNNLTDAARPAALFAPGTVRTRTFDTPESLSITFHEVHAKSIVSRVPDGSKPSKVPLA
ncbi:hypothetical protein [Streptomyces europaeiscabiei]|uniref:hypothetical protein n=1 Tax=Streptomyces europaeiscabiei TaxID=146819 RepID=UPI0039A473E6